MSRERPPYLLNNRTSVTAVRHRWGECYTSCEGSHRMTTWANAAVHSGGSEKFDGDVFRLSSWYNF